MNQMYGAAAARERSNAPLVLALVLGLVIGAAAAWVLKPEPAEQLAMLEQPAERLVIEPPALTAEPKETNAPAADCREVQAKLDDATSKLAVETMARRDAESTAADNAAGLRKAVIELNRLKGEAANAQRLADMQASNARQRSSSGGGGSSGPDAGWVIVRRPAVSIVGGSVTVSGSVHNTNREAISGSVIIEVTANGQRVGGGQVGMSIPGRTVDTYQTSYRIAPGAQGVSVVASWGG